MSLWCPDGLTFLSEELFLLHAVMHTQNEAPHQIYGKFWYACFFVAQLLADCKAQSQSHGHDTYTFWSDRVFFDSSLWSVLGMVWIGLVNFYSSLFHPVHPIKQETKLDGPNLFTFVPPTERSHNIYAIFGYSVTSGIYLPISRCFNLLCLWLIVM